MKNWSIRQVRKLLSEMETYATENSIPEEEVIVTQDPAVIYLVDMGWDEREVYGKHTERTPKLKEIQV